MASTVDPKVLDIINARAPELIQDLSEATLNTLSDQSELMTGQAFGELRPTAVALRILHWRAKAAMGTEYNGGVIASESEGQLSRSYAGSGAVSPDEDLSGTGFGKELLSLWRSCICTVGNRVSGFAL